MSINKDKEWSPSNLNGYTALITGAGSGLFFDFCVKFQYLYFLKKGIGKAIALKLAKEGCNIYAISRREEVYTYRNNFNFIINLIQTLNKTVELIKTSTSVKIEGAAFDIQDKEKLKECVNDCISKFGKLNILVNNAGLGCLTDSDLKLWEITINVNLLSVMRLTKYSLPHLEDTASKGERTAIINIGSYCSVNKVSYLAPYVASKHGLNGFSGSLFDHIRKKGIKVCSILPGWVDTKMIEPIPYLDKEKCLTPEQIAHTAYFVITFPENGCPTEIHINPQYHD